MIFHILQTSRRRETIRYLLDNDGPVRMRDIAEHVAALEHDTTVRKLESTQRQRVYIPLYQSHLPTLEEEGIIEYDKSRGIVRPTDQLELFRPYLDITNGTQADTQYEGHNNSQTDWSESLTLIATCANVLLASIVGVYAAVSGTNVGLFPVAILGLLVIGGIALWATRRTHSKLWWSKEDPRSTN